MIDGNELISALNELEKERGISKDLVIEALEISLVTACKKNYGSDQPVKVIIDRELGTIEVYAQKEVVEEVYDDAIEITVEDAKDINVHYEIGDFADVQVIPRDFGRISAQTAKQVVLQKIREAERTNLFEKLKEREQEIVMATIQRRNRGNLIVSFDDIEAVLPQSEQIEGEMFERNERVQVYVTEIKQTTKGPSVTVSRTHPELVKRLFEQNITEIYDGTVEIKAISREAGSRTKIAVYSKDENVDAVGACVGPNGLRVNNIVKELKGEKVDIINWSEDPVQYISESLSPSKVVTVVVDEENRTAKAVVPDNQLSLAIGKFGQNVRLAVRLTDWKIDIKSETQAEETNFLSDDYGKKEAVIEFEEELDLISGEFEELETELDELEDSLENLEEELDTELDKAADELFVEILEGVADALVEEQLEEEAEQAFEQVLDELAEEFIEE